MPVRYFTVTKDKVHIYEKSFLIFINKAKACIKIDYETFSNVFILIELYHLIGGKCSLMKQFRKHVYHI